jgi:hypothetical protein
MPRWSVYACATVLALAGIACFGAASIEWSNRAAMESPLPGEAAEQAWFVAELYAIGLLEMVASLAILLIRSRAAWWAVAGLQAGLLLLSIAEGLLTDPPGWISFGAVPLLAALLLVWLRAAASRWRTA